MIEHIKTSIVEENKQLSRRFKTLVVDDEPDLADIAGELLIYHDIDAMVVYSAHEAIKLLEAHSDFDALFSDVMMPCMTGLDLAEHVANTYPVMRIVLTSGYTPPACWERHTRRFPFIEKPYSIDRVIGLLKA